MAIAPRGRRAGLVEIRSRESKLKEEAKKRHLEEKKEVSQEEHEARLKILVPSIITNAIKA